MPDSTPKTIEDYIQAAPSEVRPRLRQLHELIRSEAPTASEGLSWGMPTFKLNGNLVHFAIAKRHIGLYPGAEGVSHFQDRLTEFRTSKGAIQLPLDAPLPTDLIRDIVRFRVAQQQAKAR